MFTLPEFPGQYKVGSTTFAIPVGTAGTYEPVVVGSSKLNESALHGSPGSPALTFEEVVFTAYYPADVDQNTSKGFWRSGLHRSMHWLARPVKESLRGYSYFGEIPFWLTYTLLGGFAALLKIPVYHNAPLLHPKHRHSSENEPWPLVFFSHGLGGTQTNYSHICSRIASTGRVVLAFEHHDGTSPFIIARSRIPGSKEHARSEYKYYLNPKDVQFDNDTRSDKFPLRTDQLLFRRLEVYFTHKKFQELVINVDSTSPPEQQTIHTIEGARNIVDTSPKSEDTTFWNSWLKDTLDSSPKVNFQSNITLSGHSFGGATVFSILSQPPPTLHEVAFDPLPVDHALVFDPWLDPLPSPGPSPLELKSSLSPSSNVPNLLVLNSEGYTLWEDHFNRLREIVHTWSTTVAEQSSRTSSLSKPAPSDSSKSSSKTRLITLIRAQHPSFSDFGILIPFGKRGREGKIFLDVISQLSIGFLDGRLDDELTRQNVKENTVETIKKSKEEEKRLVGDVGDIVINI
ncbi:platelet-activating factor acetylhydrolase [Abortiporus biennis]|nr:platelet-activating factor acetylhydrolase [Abortiporus biennis]